MAADSAADSAGPMPPLPRFLEGTPIGRLLDQMAARQELAHLAAGEGVQHNSASAAGTGAVPAASTPALVTAPALAPAAAPAHAQVAALPPAESLCIKAGWVLGAQKAGQNMKSPFASCILVSCNPLCLAAPFASN